MGEKINKKSLGPRFAPAWPILRDFLYSLPLQHTNSANFFVYSCYLVGWPKTSISFIILIPTQQLIEGASMFVSPCTPALVTAGQCQKRINVVSRSRSGNWIHMPLSLQRIVHYVGHPETNKLLHTSMSNTTKLLHSYQPVITSFTKYLWIGSQLLDWKFSRRLELISSFKMDPKTPL